MKEEILKREFNEDLKALEEMGLIEKTGDIRDGDPVYDVTKMGRDRYDELAAINLQAEIKRLKALLSKACSEIKYLLPIAGFSLDYDFLNKPEIKDILKEGSDATYSIIDTK